MNLQAAKEANARITLLLNDPHPGLFTWNILLAKSVEDFALSMDCQIVPLVVEEPI